MNKQFTKAMNRQWRKTHPKSYKRVIEFGVGAVAALIISHIVGNGLSFLIIF